MLPTSSLKEKNFGLHEPVHDSASNIAGKGIVNFLATIIPAAMMLRFSFNKADVADRIEAAVKKVLALGFGTGDIIKPGMQSVGTREMGSVVLVALE